MSRPTRREWIASTAAGVAGLLLAPRGRRLEASSSESSGSENYPPIRTLTRGPSHHWFGYYDKLQFDPSNRYVLAGQVGFEHRTPRATDTIRVGMVDTARNDAWVEIGSSRAWGWQQGCMLQWRPGTSSEVLWNDREGERYVCRSLDVVSGKRRTFPMPIYTLSPDGRFALTANFSRIQAMRPGYGYVGLPDPHGDDLAPKDSGVFRMDLETGATTLVLPLAEIARIPFKGAVLEERWHYFNHILVAPDSQRFIVLHRFRPRDKESGRPSGRYDTRMVTANVDGSDVFVLDPSGHTSHFIWQDAQHVCMWTRPEGKQGGFYLFRDRTRAVESVGAGVMTQNGHNTYVPGTNNEWILNDTYPGKDRRQRPYLFHVPTARRVELGAFYSPRQYRGEWRCDTHPRSSADGRWVSIDSPHGGRGRQVHLIDVGEIIG